VRAHTSRFFLEDNRIRHTHYWIGSFHENNRRFLRRFRTKRDMGANSASALDPISCLLTLFDSIRGTDPVVDAPPIQRTHPSRSSATTDGMSDRNECAILSRIRVPWRARRRGGRGDASTGSARSSIQRSTIPDLRGMRRCRVRHRDARRQSGQMADDWRGCRWSGNRLPLLAEALRPSACQP